MDHDDSKNPPLVAGEDYYLENGLMVFTARYHLRRGYCCDSNCRHCPYKEQTATSPISTLLSKILGQPENCESCGEPFVCGASLKGCWCTGVKLTESTRQTLLSKFKNCVCQKCLEKAEVKNQRATHIDE